MNINAIDQPKDAAVAAGDAERAPAAPKHPDTADTRKTLAAPGAEAALTGQAGQAGQPDAKQVLSQAQSYFKDKGVDLHFKLLEDSKDVQVEVMDKDERKVIMKIPRDEIVKLSEGLRKMAKGVLDKAV
ncbi:flagellar protein FlaG [Fundidesulfovibrio agrisoli]|uniref:flagellar protein FlaG n=1 Tax=Fundidesulfovibrio agrisoli TaxID=2922717 RepID=UPI001FAC8B38|nr:flagellar protein FlaG [Fundidesulfovibrio agrisoli]